MKYDKNKVLRKRSYFNHTIETPHLGLVCELWGHLMWLFCSKQSYHIRSALWTKQTMNNILNQHVKRTTVFPYSNIVTKTKIYAQILCTFLHMQYTLKVCTRYMRRCVCCCNSFSFLGVHFNLQVQLRLRSVSWMSSLPLPAAVLKVAPAP